VTVHLVAAGPGDPGLWTVRVEALLAAAPVVVCDEGLAEPVRVLAPAARIETVADGAEAAPRLVVLAGAHDGVVRLARGDRLVWEAGGIEAAALRAAGVAVEVVPAVVAAFAGPAAAGVPVMSRDRAATLTLTRAADPGITGGTVVALEGPDLDQPEVAGPVTDLDLTGRSDDQAVSAAPPEDGSGGVSPRRPVPGLTGQSDDQPVSGAPVVHVVGLLGGAPVGPEATAALATAATVIGSTDQLAAAAPWLAAGARRIELGAGLGGLHALTGDADDDRPEPPDASPVCVLASGDPGFFGIVRALGARLGAGRLRVHPAPSSVALAFARLGLPWDDAVVVSAHARALDTVTPVVRRARRAAVLTSPENPPEALGKALMAEGCGPRQVAVCSRLAEPGEEVIVTGLDGLAAGTFAARSVVVVTVPEPSPSRPTTWGRDTTAFAHRASMITKPEVRAAVLGRLDLPDGGVLWDLGAGSGSVALEAALAAPGLRVIAVERRPDDAARIRANAAALGALVEVVEGDARTVIDALPRPDRVFVGGGGLDVLDRAQRALAPGGRLVATFAAADRAAEAYRRLGQLVQISVDRADTLPDGGVRFVADNPVFVAWGGARPVPLVVGVGCSSAATPAEAIAAVDAALHETGHTRADIATVATIDRRVDHPAVTALDRPVRAFTAAELAAVTVPSPSAVVDRAVGTPSVAEAAALLAAGPGARLVRTKATAPVAGKGAATPAAVTVAVAAGPDDREIPAPERGSLAVVGLGPGDSRHRTPAAVEALRAAEVVIGFGPYVDQAADLLRPDQRVVRSSMGDEAARATEAVERARAGERVAVVSSGDPGVFAMASVTLELAAELAPDLTVTVVPGVTAGQAAAALAGAPLAHDHVVISLSDRLTSWAAIEARLRAAAASDLVVALYNPRSRARAGPQDRARAVLAEHRAPTTPVVVVTNAARSGEVLTRTTLADLDPDAVDMNTIVLIGSSATAVLNDRVVTRRHHPRPPQAAPGTADGEGHHG
jgi:precorrin-3B C17-methyltransferase/precorrin-6y C5,15-methyltransferase (decarboxylating) CbiE subunit/precorrin-6Y C5,15-methyltransferase (decarboxylating) CbiT subunit